MKKCRNILCSLVICILLFSTFTTFPVHASVHLPIAEDCLYFGFNDIDEFIAYLETAKTTDEIPSTFVYPQEFSPIGSLNTWGSPMYTQQHHDNSIYYYGIDLWEEDATVWFEIKHKTYTDLSTYTVLDKSYAGEDMRTLSNVPNDSERYIIRRGALYYFYSNKQLRFIRWYRISEYYVDYNGWYISGPIVDTLTFDPFGKLFESNFSYTPGSFMEKLLSLDEEKFQEAHDILVSLGTGKYIDYEYTPPATEPTITPSEPTAPSEPATLPTQPTPPPTVPHTTPQKTEQTQIVTHIITAMLSFIAGSTVTVSVLQKKKRQRGNP